MGPTRDVSTAAVVDSRRPWVQVHASSLLVLADDSYLVAWFAGAHEGAADSRIHVLRRTGSTTSVAVIAADDDQPHWNPVLAHGPGERLWLFFKRGWRIDRWSTWVCHSSDNGHTWTTPSSSSLAIRPVGVAPCGKPHCAAATSGSRHGICQGG